MRPVIPYTQPALFIELYLKAFVKPGRVFTRLVHSPRQLNLATTAVSITAIGYTLVYAFLIAGGGQPYRPWLAIPPEVYYRYNVFF